MKYLRKKLAECWAALRSPRAVAVSGSVDDEQFKIDIVRILFGLVLLLRYVPVAVSSFEFFEGPEAMQKIVLCQVMVLLSFGVCAGIATPLSLIGLMALARFYDLYIGSVTLGTAVILVVLLGLLLCGAGKFCSIDGWLSRQGGVAKWTRFSRFRLSDPGPAEFRKIYLLIFGLFAAISFGAVQYHFLDSLWYEGKTMRIGFQNAFLCEWYPFFRWLDSICPALMSFISLCVTVLQSFWELLMFPLIFFRHGRWYAIGFGILFFFMSEYALILSSLPRSESCLWLLVFAPAKWFVGARDWVMNRIFHREASSRDENFPAAPVVFRSKRFYHSLMVIYGVLIAVFISTQPWFNAIYGGTRNARKVELPLTYLGMHTPNVYTEPVMRVADRWALVYRVLPGSERKILIPLNGRNGERLAYQDLDLIFYGRALPMRRRHTKVSHEYYLEGAGHDFLKEIVAYDANRESVPQGTRYEVEIKEIDGLNLELPPRKRYRSKTVATFTMQPPTPD